MYRGHSIGVVVPAYNEGSFVGEVVRELPAFVDEVYLVDDASIDDTWTEMGTAMSVRGDGGQQVGVTDRGADRTFERLDGRIAAAETVGNVTRLRHDENRGAGGAIKTGYVAALESGVDVVATIDGDGQMDADRLPALLDPVVEGRAEYAKGTRFAGSDVLGEMPPFRRFGNVLLTWLTRPASGYWRLSDPQNGFTAITSDALAAVEVEEMWEYYGYMNQLLARLNVAGVTVADVPMPASYGEENSHIDYVQYVRRVSMLLLVTFLTRVYTTVVRDGFRPSSAGYVAGMLLGAVSLFQGVCETVSGERRTLWTALAGLGAAVVLFAVGAVFDAVEDPTVLRERDERAGQEGGR